MVDEVTFVLKLLEDNWDTYKSNGLSGHIITDDDVNFIDVRSIEPNKGRRVDADQKAVIVVYEESANLDHPTIDWGVRNEEYTFTQIIWNFITNNKVEVGANDI